MHGATPEVLSKAGDVPVGKAARTVGGVGGLAVRVVKSKATMEELPLPTKGSSRLGSPTAHRGLRGGLHRWHALHSIAHPGSHRTSRCRQIPETCSRRARKSSCFCSQSG